MYVCTLYNFKECRAFLNKWLFGTFCYAVLYLYSIARWPCLHPKNCRSAGIEPGLPKAWTDWQRNVPWKLKEHFWKNRLWSILLFPEGRQAKEPPGTLQTLPLVGNLKNGKGTLRTKFLLTRPCWLNVKGTLSLLPIVSGRRAGVGNTQEDLMLKEHSHCYL